MRARWSLFDVWFYGAIAFIAVTASLALAFSIAITGPPTDEEMEGVEAALGRASRDIAVLASQVGDEACVQLPPEVTTGLCPEQSAEQNEPLPAQPEDIADLAPYPAAPDREAPPGLFAQAETPADLLGGERAEPPRAEARPQAPERRVRAAPPPRAPRPPIVRAEVELVPPLPQRESESVAALPAIARAEITTPEDLMEEAIYERDGPTQDRAEPAAGNEDDWYEREGQYAEGEEGYYDEAYEERRERRRERRRQRRERYYGGW
jgi:hypothetical protein